MPIDLSKIKAIDVHVHAEVSCHDPEDPVMGKFFDAASAYFKAPRERPKMPEIIEIYREQQIAFCMFTVDCESGIGAKRVSNYEIAEIANKNDDICIPFASIDPHKGKMGAREARDLIENHGVKGFKFHHIMQNLDPAAQVGYPIYEVINEYKLPAIFHTGHSGMGTGMRGGGGRACQGRAAPRHQAIQHAGRHRRRGQGDRLRPLEGPRHPGWPLARDGDRRDHRHAPLHGAGAGEREEDDRRAGEVLHAQGDRLVLGRVLAAAVPPVAKTSSTMRTLCAG